MKLTNKKIVGVVISLLAVVSVVQTQAIIKLTKLSTSQSQKAQVTNYATCLKLSPASVNHTSFIDPTDFSDTYNGLNKHMFVIGLKIKNMCDTAISIIKDSYSYPNGTNSFQIAKMEDFPNITNPTVLQSFSVNGPARSNISDIYGVLSPDMIIPNIYLTGVIPTGDGEMKAYTLQPKVEKDFIVFSYGDANASDIISNTRLSLKKIRWFYTQAFADSLLTSSEVKTYNLTTIEIGRFTTGYARFKNVFPVNFKETTPLKQ